MPQDAAAQPQIDAALEPHPGGEQRRIPARGVVPDPARTRALALRDPCGQLRLREIRATELGAPVVDTQWRLNFPTEHPLDMRMSKDIFKQADLITLLDCRDWERPTHVNDRINRTLKPLFPKGCDWLDIGFADIEISKWAADYQRYPDCALRLLADPALAMPALTSLISQRVRDDARLAGRVEERAHVHRIALRAQD